MPNSLKKMMATFEEKNISSIKPLPPIQNRPDQNAISFKSDEKLTELVELKPKKERKPLPSVVPRPPAGVYSKYEFYINSQVPTEQGHLAEPLFELTKRDAHKAQRQIHQSVVKNEIIDRSNQADYDNTQLEYVLDLISKENKLFHKNSKLSNKIHSGYRIRLLTGYLTAVEISTKKILKGPYWCLFVMSSVYS